MEKFILFLFVSTLSVFSYAEKGEFGVNVTIATKGFFPPKLTSVIVDTVKEESPASKAGISPGDVVVSINDCVIPGCSAFKAKKEMNKKVGETVDFTIQKAGGETSKVTLTAE